MNGNEVGLPPRVYKPPRRLELSRSCTLFYIPLFCTQGLRRVSFSDTQLSIQHVYPKYDYKDYDEAQSDDGNESQGYFEESTDGNSGLSHRLHPSLRSGETGSQFYRYNASPIKDNQSGNSLHQYTPSILSGFGSELQQHLSGLSSSTRNETKFSPEPSDQMPAGDDQTNDIYTNLNSDTAAMLW